MNFNINEYNRVNSIFSLNTVTCQLSTHYWYVTKFLAYNNCDQNKNFIWFDKKKLKRVLQNH